MSPWRKYREELAKMLEQGIAEEYAREILGPYPEEYWIAKTVNDIYRRKAPSVSSEVVGLLNANMVGIIVDEVLGDEIDGNSSWYMMLSGAYAWSGGFYDGDILEG